MRHEFYADSRDVWKWTCALRAAKLDSWILYVAMLSDDPEKSYTKNFSCDDECQKTAVEFFDYERRHITIESPLWRIQNLDHRIEVIRNKYNWVQTDGYFEQVASKLR